MALTFIDVPFDPGDLVDVAFEADVAAALTRAYDLMGRRAYPQARAAVLAIDGQAMAERQLIRVRYVQGRAAVESHEVPAALGPLDEALDHVLRLDEAAACAKLAALQGAAHYYLQQCRSSAHYYFAALDAWHDRKPRPPLPSPEDLSFEVEMGTRLGIQLFWLGRYPAAVRRLRHARQLATALPAPAPLIARIEWMLALVHRWRGMPERALRHALAAFDGLQEHAAPEETGRLLTVLADVTLDLAAGYAGHVLSSAAEGLVRAARTHADDALAHARYARDAAGEAIAKLAYVRALRGLRDGRVDRLAAIDAVGRQAEELGDLALLIQALTARGDELASRQEPDAAANAYRAALDAARQSRLPALGVWAQRALWRVAGDASAGAQPSST
jgi:hypothetical protein